MLQNWLNLDSTSHSYANPKGYELVTVAEQHPVDIESAKCAIRSWIRHCYCSSDYVERRVGSGAFGSPEDLYQQEKFPQQWNNRAADFGEAISHFVLESHPRFGFWLPVLRLREKPDPEGSPRGFDILGFLLAEQLRVNVLCIGEARLRTTTTRIRETLVAGYRTLVGYTRRRESRAIGRIAHWLYEQSKAEDADKLARFGDAWAEQPFERRHVFIGIFNTSLPVDNMIDAMNNVPDTVATFVACIVAVGDLRRWIEEAYAHD